MASASSSTPPEYSRAPHKMSTIIEEPSAGPIHPPGLLPLPNDRLWKPHEDKYWTQLREQWNSAVDLNEADHVAPSAESHAKHVQHLDDHSHGSEEDMDDIDLCTANGTVFRIVLAHGDQHAQERDSGGSPAAHRTMGIQPGPRHINHTPLVDALSLHFPPAAVQKQPRKKAFGGRALNVSVTTSTRTYGDFSKMNPPPYTPRPTNAERSFGRNGKFVHEEDQTRSKWPVAKWLFFIGFVFPLLWLFGSFLLFSGLRKLGAESQAESQDSTTAKFDTRPGDTNHSLHTTNNITHLIAQEVLWSKRCALAFVCLAVACFITLGVLKAVGM